MEEASFEPRAILVADMVGYSRWLAQQPVATYAAFTSHVRHVFGPAVRAHAGKVIKTTGDGIVAIFGDAGAAENAARDIQVRMEQGELALHPDVDLRYRLAVHYGNVMILPDDVLGIAVNAAMHMQGLAPSGGICISGDLFVQLNETRKAQYSYAGSKYIKNIPDPIELYLARSDFGASARDRTASPPVLRRGVLSPLPRLGIADLRVHTEAAPRHILAAFVQDALMEGLSRFRDLFVVSPLGTVVIQSAGLREHLSNEFALEYLVHGSCFVDVNEIIIIVHLEYLPRKVLLWSIRTKVDAARLEGIGPKVINECVTPIVLHLQRNEADAWDAIRRTEDERSFQEAQALMAQRTLPALDQARRMLARILERCGEIGNVYIALARAEHSHGLLLAGERFVEAVEQARLYAEKAIALDELNPRAHGELALQDLFLKGYASAAAGYQRALRLNPYDPVLLADWADCLTLTGRAEEAVPILENLSPTSPSDKAWIEWNLCDAAWALNRPERIVEILRDKPDLPHVHRFLAASCAKLGRMSEARYHADQVRRHQPNFSAREWRNVVPWRAECAEDYADCLAMAGL
jgi:class 3 adenylate cyclase/tetratricopeptide (TPR) repeat protein